MNNAILSDVSVNCPCCGKKSVIENIDLLKLQEWKRDNKLIQTVFPEMSSEDREILISGYCTKCQNDIFKEY